jgi:hypothetical protein
VVHIGGQAHKGHGEVEQAIVREVEADPTWFGIVGTLAGRRTVLRPVPQRLVHLLPPETDGFDTVETWDYPYFPGHPKAVVERCLVPPLTNSDYIGRDMLRGLYSH